MKIGLQTVCAADLELDGVIQLAAETGLDGVELAAGYLGRFRGEPDGPEWHISTDDVLASAEKAALLARDAGVEIFGFASRAGVDDLGTFESLCRAASSIGCPAVRIMPGRFDPELGFAGSMERSRAGLYEALSVAEKYNVRAVVELHDNTMADGVLACWELVRDMDPRRVGIIFDVGNARVFGYQPWAEAIDVLGPHIAYVHAKDVTWDVTGGGGNLTWCDPGKGLVEWDDIIAQLRSHGFDGYISIEDYRGGWCKKNPDWPAERKVREWKRFLDDKLGSK